MEERGLVGLEARTTDGEEIGRISEVLTDEESGELTHVLVEREGRRFEFPIGALSLDPEADYATYHPEYEAGLEETVPLEYGTGNQRHEGQLVTEPESTEEARSEADLVREDWEDESHTPVDSGYPRSDAYIDPETGEAEVDPAMNEGGELRDDVERMLDETGLEIRAVKDGIVALTGEISSRQDLEELIAELMELDGVREVDVADVDVG